MGIWLSVSQGSFATFSPSFPSLSAANMVIAIGAIVMVTGFLGCLGAIKENKCLLLSVSLSTYLHSVHYINTHTDDCPSINAHTAPPPYTFFLPCFLSFTFPHTMQILTEMPCEDSFAHMWLYTYTHLSQASENSAAYLYFSSKWNHSSRRLTEVQSALYQTSAAHKGKLELSSGILPFCKLTLIHSCHFHGSGHSPVRALSVRRPFVSPTWLNYCM